MYNGTKASLSILALLIAGVAVLPVPVSGFTAGTLTITANTVLIQDHFGDIVIASDGITLDCAGFTVTGSGSGSGIRVEARTGTTVKNCVVTGFNTGFDLFLSDGNTFTDNTASFISRPFLLDDSHGNIFTGNTATGGVVGFGLTFSSGNTFAGNTATSSNFGFDLPGNLGNGFRLDSSVRNIFTGNTADSNNQGFLLESSSSNIFTDNTAIDNRVVGFLLVELSFGNTFTGNTATSFILNPPDGFLLDSSIGNIFTGNAATGGVVGFGLTSSSENAFTDNTAIDNDRGFDLESSSSNAFTDNTAIDNDRGFALTFSSSNAFTGNTAIDNFATGFSIFESSSNAFTGNTAIDSFRDGFSLTRSSSNTFTGNAANFNGDDGFRLSNSDGNAFTGNSVSFNGNGFFLIDSSSNAFTDNTAIDNEHGFSLFGSSSNAFTDNTAYSSVDGFRLDSSIGNIFTGNAAIDNFRNGFFLGSSSSSNTLTENAATSNGVGFSLGSSHSNLVTHNNIIDNAVQATDTNPAANNWHHPSFLEGNFWSDYTGADDGSGALKHAIAGDGIGDTDIPWPSPGFDNFPFVAPIDDGFPAQVLEGNRISLLQLLIDGQTLLSIPSTEASFVAHGFALCLVDTPISTALSPEQRLIFVDARLYRFELAVDGSEIPLTQALRFSEDAQCPLRLTTLFFAQFSPGEFLGPQTFTGTFFRDLDFDGVVDTPPALTITVTVDYEFEVVIVGGETLTLTATVQPGTQQTSFESSWAGSHVVMTLISPSGRVIDPETAEEDPDVTYELTLTSEAYTVTNPEAGAWTIELFGADVPPDGEAVTLSVEGATIEATPDLRIEVLGASVAGLVDAGGLNEGQGNALTSKLEGAIKKLDQGKVNSAIDKLQAFVKKVNSFIDEGLISLENGGSLIGQAEGVIAELGG